MNLEQVTPGEVDELVVRLASAWPGRRTAQALSDYATELRRHVKHWTRGDLERAVTLAIAQLRYFPSVGDLIRVAHEVTRRDDVDAARRAQQAGTRCDQCGEHYFYAGYWCPGGVVLPRIRCACPQAGRGWEHPDALAWQESDPVMTGAGFSPPRERAQGAPAASGPALVP